MHEQHRTSGAPATLRVEPRHGPFLREFFEIYRGGRLGDLAQPYGTDAATLARIRAVADTCGRIIEASTAARSSPTQRPARSCST